MMFVMSCIGYCAVAVVHSDTSEIQQLRMHTLQWKYICDKHVKRQSRLIDGCALHASGSMSAMQERA